jgi:hypothetical protein
MLRIGFLFNHSCGHQVAHALPVAMASAWSREQVDLRVLVAPGACEEEVRRLCSGYRGPVPTIIPLRPAAKQAKILHALSGRAVPFDTLSVLYRNLDHFRALDALVVPEKTSLLLKSLFRLRSLKLIHTRHGAGDRAIGFDRASQSFDLVLMSGRKIRDRLQAAGLLKPDGHAIVGYPKFDTVSHVPPPPLFDNDRPTVVYNPHPSPALSSWYRMGAQVLDYFAASDRYNLIFAPHIMLFAKRLTVSLSPFSLQWRREIPAAVRNLPHIHIDTGSPACLDMGYLRAADIYLGDASSQVYEFIRQPRPCIFLNPAGHCWEENLDFAHWRTGPVVQSVDALDGALAQAVANPRAYRTIQNALFNYSFDIDDRPSAERAATAILEFMNR